MSSKKKRSLHGKETEQKSGLSRHYREIGIKAGRCSDTGKESTALASNPYLDGDKPQKEQYGRRTQ